MCLNEEHTARRDLSWLRWASLLTIGLAAVLWAGVAMIGPGGSESFAGQELTYEKHAPEARFPMVENGTISGVRNLSQAFRMAAKRVLPAVVVIKTSNRQQPIGGVDRDENPPMQAFEDMGDEEDFDWQDDQPEPGLASGVVIDPKGIVLTNNHVVEGADEVIVRLPDGRQLAAIVERTDSDWDLAVLRVKADTPLPAARLGDSEAMEIGDWVLAIGCPFDLEQTVSAGIISAKGRSLDEAGKMRLLQTDAAINPGSSGGPLVNLDGEVVGITSGIASGTGGYQGIAFAVPSSLAKQLCSPRPLAPRGPSQPLQPGHGRDSSSTR